MNPTKFLMAAAPVVVGVFVAGLLMNAFRSNSFVRSAIDGFDS